MKTLLLPLLALLLASAEGRPLRGIRASARGLQETETNQESSTTEGFYFSLEKIYLYALPRGNGRSLVDWDKEEFDSILQAFLTLQWRGFAGNIQVLSERQSVEVMRNGTIEIQERIKGSAFISSFLESADIDKRLKQTFEDTTSLVDLYGFAQDSRIAWIFDVSVDAVGWKYTRESDNVVVVPVAAEDKDLTLVLVMTVVSLIICQVIGCATYFYVRKRDKNSEDPKALDDQVCAFQNVSPSKTKYSSATQEMSPESSVREEFLDLKDDDVSSMGGTYASGKISRSSSKQRLPAPPVSTLAAGKLDDDTSVASAEFGFEQKVRHYMRETHIVPTRRPRGSIGNESDISFDDSSTVDTSVIAKEFALELVES